MKSLLIASFLLIAGVSFGQVKLNKQTLKKTTETAVKKEKKKKESSTPENKSNLNNARKRPGTKSSSSATERKRPGTKSSTTPQTKSGGL